MNSKPTNSKPTKSKPKSSTEKTLVNIRYFEYRFKVLYEKIKSINPDLRNEYMYDAILTELRETNNNYFMVCKMVKGAGRFNGKEEDRQEERLLYRLKPNQSFDPTNDLVVVGDQDNNTTSATDSKTVLKVALFHCIPDFPKDETLDSSLYSKQLLKRGNVSSKQKQKTLCASGDGGLTNNLFSDDRSVSGSLEYHLKDIEAELSKKQFKSASDYYNTSENAGVNPASNENRQQTTTRSFITSLFINSPLPDDPDDPDDYDTQKNKMMPS